jgi:putative transposase
VTKGLIRIYGQKHLHFITFSTFRREPSLTPHHRTYLLEQLEVLRSERRFQVCGYVVMPEHFHFLIGEPAKGTPSTLVQLLKQRCAVTFNAESGTRGSRFWQPRFYDFNVVTHKKRVEKLRYMHNNPVTRGLVNHAQDWEWSSYRFYHGGNPSPVLIDPS